MELLSRPRSGAEAPLEKLTQTAALPQIRLQALSALDGLAVLAPSTLVTALGDAHERVRSEAVRLVRKLSRNRESHEVILANFSQNCISLTNDTSLLVVRQLAFTLGEWGDPAAGSCSRSHRPKLAASRPRCAPPSSAPPDATGRMC